jgi:lysine-N-methylase
MKVTVPDYYDQFHCLAGACPHSCCEKWEVVIDEESVCLYETVSGPLGEKLREAMETDEDGDICFPLNGGRCPFLDQENLCEIHKQLGEQATSETCREHPRFTEDYGVFREITLSASCPAANDLLLGSEEPLVFKVLETEEPEEEGDSWLEYLLPLRERMMRILYDRNEPLNLRLRRFLLLAAEAQWRLDEEMIETLPALAAEWQEKEIPVGIERPLFPDVLRLLAGLEILEESWRDLLREGESIEANKENESLLERIAVYFAFRYLLKCVNDGDLLSRAQLCVLAVLVIERLAAVCGLSEALRRFSCELEHSDENLETLQEILFRGEKLSLHQVLCSLGQ